jgi:hypothetical protein
MPMKIRSLLAISVFLISFVSINSEAAETRKSGKANPGLPLTEKAVIPPISYYLDQKESLRGLKGIGLLLEPLNPEIEKAGIARDQLKQDVALQLRQSGIRVLNEEVRGAESGKPYLYINLNAYSWREEVIYGYSLKVDLNQLILLDRDKKIGCFGTTWYSGSAGIVGANKMKGFIRAELADTIDKFIQDYSAVNPK